MTLQELIYELRLLWRANTDYHNQQVYIQIGNEKVLLTEIDFHVDDSGEEIIRKIVLS